MIYVAWQTKLHEYAEKSCDFAGTDCLAETSPHHTTGLCAQLAVAALNFRTFHSEHQHVRRERVLVRTEALAGRGRPRKRWADRTDSGDSWRCPWYSPMSTHLPVLGRHYLEILRP